MGVFNFFYIKSKPNKLYYIDYILFYLSAWCRLFCFPAGFSFQSENHLGDCDLQGFPERLATEMALRDRNDTEGSEQRTHR